MMQKTICVAAALLPLLLAAGARAAGGDAAPLAELGAPTVVSGKVFLDANGNGALDPGEKGIPGVRVTDGVDFVTTDKHGAYSIRIGADRSMPYRPAQTVGVCWPTGLWPTSMQWWIRLSEVGDPRAVHFGLREDSQKLPFLYLHMTDPHEHFNTAHLDFADFVNALPSDVKFIIDTGDSFRPKSAEKPFNRLFFSAVGNHDTWESSDPPPTPDEGGCNPWTRRLGPIRWSFDHAGIHFVGVDVIEGHKIGPMIDWLEKDFKSLKPGTRIVLSYHYPDLSGPERFTKLLNDYKVELVHGGHDHAYGYSDSGRLALLTAYHWGPPGTCNALVVSKDRIDHGYYCIGCKKSFGRHSRRCPIDWSDHVLLSGIRGLFTKPHGVEPGPLAAERSVQLADPQVYVQASIDPAKAKRVGLRIGPGGKTIDIVFTGDRLIVDGASVPFSFRPGQRTLDLKVFAHYNMLTMWANNYYFMEKSVTLDKASQVTVFAEGGEANIVSMSVQEVKADPDNRNNRYACACNHGQLIRNPIPKQ